MLQCNSPHPGAFIERTYLEPNDLRSVDVVTNLKVSASTFSRLINEKSVVSLTLTLKLSKVLWRSPESWFAMQPYCDLWKAMTKADLHCCKPIKL